MDSKHGSRTFAFDCPAAYRICVEGYLDAAWSARLADMTISPGTSDQGGPTATMVGELRDQVALAGVLNTLYDLHLPVVLVERLHTEQVQAKKTAP